MTYKIDSIDELFIQSEISKVNNFLDERFLFQNSPSYEESFFEDFSKFFLMEFNPANILVRSLGAIFFFIFMGSLIVNGIIFSLMLNPNMDLGLLGATRTIMAYQYDPYARSIAVNITRDCLDDTECSFYEIVDYMRGFNYSVDGNMNSRLYPIKQTIEDSAGECENLSFLFAKLYSEVGGIVTIHCNSCHCWNDVIIEKDPYDDDTDRLYLIFDATSGAVYMKDNYILDMMDRVCESS